MLTLWRPQRDLFHWGREFDQLFNGHWPAEGQLSFSPEVDVEETEESLVLTADLPGMKEKDIEVSVHEGTLTLSGKREEASEQKRRGGTLRERRYGSFSRQFRLGRNVKADGIKASYKDGVLTVTLPKRPEAKPRQIPVKNN